MRMARIGITGPIGCGKSTVAGMLAEHGAIVIDADRLVREVYEDAAVRRGRRRSLRARRSNARRLDRSTRAGRDRVRRSGRPARSRGDRPSRRSAANPGRRSKPLTLRVRRRSSWKPSSWSRVGSPACATRSGWSPVTRRSSVAASGIAASTEDDAERRIAAQRHLRDRVEPVATRRIDTSGSLADTRLQVVAAWQDIDR